MPVITIDMLEGKTPEQKRELIEKITDVVCGIVKCQREVVTIIFHDISRDDWGSGGVQKSQIPPK